GFSTRSTLFPESLMLMRTWIRSMFAHRVTRPIRRGPQQTRLALEVMEDRTVPTTFTVNSTGDLGAGVGMVGDLRYCINEANAHTGDDTSIFSSTVFNTPQTINLTQGQLELTDTSGTETITGPAGGVTVNGGGNSRVFQVDGLVTASISGMTITGGN